MNLVIGNTSQISYYFPEDYKKISSRNIDFNLYKDKFYDRIFICFSEQRTYLGNSNLFYEINVDYTKKVIEFFKNKCNKLIVYGTSELWNNCNGEITIDTPFNNNETDYIKSKEILVNETKGIDNLIFIHPFNFNTTHRKGGYLFAKIFESIINETPTEIGNTYFYRDIVRPEYVVERSINAQSDEIVGSGRLTFVNQYIRDMYDAFHMKYENYVKENLDGNPPKNIYYLKSNKCLHSYEKLFIQTFYELRGIKLKKYWEKNYG